MGKPTKTTDIVVVGSGPRAEYGPADFTRLTWAKRR